MRRLILLLVLAVLVSCRSNEPQTVAEQQIQEPGLQRGTEVPAMDAPKKGDRIEYVTATGTASGYLSAPATSTGKGPAIIVIQEWWGVDDWIKENVDRFAGEGYVAIAPDLYRGHVTSDAGEAHELMRGLPQDRAMADVRGAFNYLAARPDVDPARIGVIGWCMGGGYAAMLAAAEPRLKAAVVNYGHLIDDPASIAKINATILGNFGGQDRGIPVADVRKFESAARSAGKQVDIKIYPQQGHAFMNPKNLLQGSNAEATEDAWRRIFQFFSTKL